MKHLLLIGLVCCFHTSFCQKIIKLYDWEYKPTIAEHARYYSSLEWKDSVWERKDFYLPEKGLAMKGSYLDSNQKRPVGAFYYFYPSKNEKAKTFYNKLSEKDGLWLAWHNNGKLKDSTNYVNGGLSTTQYSWYSTGSVKYSVYFDKENGLWARRAFFRNGQVSEVAYFKSGKKQGKWSYYHASGQLSCTEEFEDGALMSAKYFDANGSEIQPQNPESRAYFEGGNKKLQKHFFKEVDFPDVADIRISRNFDLIIGFTIDENGDVDDVEVLRSVHPAFDKVGVGAVKKIKGFVPAKSKNRNIESKLVQHFDLRFLL